MADAVVQRYLAAPKGLVSNDTSSSGWPDGLDVEVFGRDLLEAANAACPVPTKREGDPGWHDREHVTPWMRRHESHSILPHWSGEDWRKVKISVDVPEDYERVQRVFGYMPAGTMGWFVLRSALMHVGLAEGVL